MLNCRTEFEEKHSFMSIVNAMKFIAINAKKVKMTQKYSKVEGELNHFWYFGKLVPNFERS